MSNETTGKRTAKQIHAAITANVEQMYAAKFSPLAFAAFRRASAALWDEAQRLGLSSRVNALIRAEESAA